MGIVWSVANLIVRVTTYLIDLPLQVSVIYVEMSSPELTSHATTVTTRVVIFVVMFVIDATQA